MERLTLLCPICNGITRFEEREKIFLRPQKYLYYCEKPSCGTILEQDKEDRVFLEKTGNKENPIWKEFQYVHLAPAAILDLGKRGELRTLHSDSSCESCRFRKHGPKCGKNESPFYDIKISKDAHICGNFSFNDAIVSYHDAMLLATEDNPDENKLIDLFQKSISGGLAIDDEIVARSIVGDTLIRLNNYDEGIKEIEKALSLDKDNRVYYFFNIISRSIFVDYECASLLMTTNILESDGLDSSIKYLEHKIDMVDYLSGRHLPLIYHKLAGFYFEKEDKRSAVKALERCLKAEYEKNRDLHIKARENAEEVLQEIAMDEVRRKQNR